MENKDFILISTSIIGLDENKDKMLELLQKPQNQDCCNASFGNNFYPVIGINKDGEVECFCDGDPLSDNLVILIIPDSKHFNFDDEEENEFSKYINAKVEQSKKFYILLHKGSGSIPDTHQKAIFKIAINHLSKIMVVKCHHTQSSSQNPAHALGDGLEMVAKAILSTIIDTEEFKAGLNYLKVKPDYYSPLKESLIHLHKSLKLLPLKFIDNWTADTFNKEKSALENLNIINLAKDKLQNILFKEDFVEFYKQLETIETEIIQLQTNG